MKSGRGEQLLQVFTIADESPYLLIFGVPSIGLLKPLEERIQKIEDVQQIRKVNHPESEEFTETYIAKFRSVNLARNVKRRLDDSSFYGGFLHIVYAPEYESVAECRVKMHSYRRLNDAEADKATRTLKLKERQRSSLNTEKTEVGLAVTDELSTSAHTSLQAKRVFTPPPKMNKEDAVLLSNPYAMPLHITSPSQSKQQRGDALDDARNYWASRGLDFLSNSKSHPIQSAHPSPIPLPIEAFCPLQKHSVLEVARLLTRLFMMGNEVILAFSMLKLFPSNSFGSIFDLIPLTNLRCS
ncbi:unnamed protein product [Taenia asiatica]|uniref:RNA-binding protein 48 n=1 Tax=Taenia asiatica TaxID=60517 RepID=A0A158R733_TAEAS|nr:unnamed protein product [Taenia asiatica]